MPESGEPLEEDEEPAPSGNEPAPPAEDEDEDEGGTEEDGAFDPYDAVDEVYNAFPLGVGMTRDGCPSNCCPSI